jgi:hypothetical protein
MKKVTRTNRQIFDISGTITGPNGLRVEVSFDLIELEDLNDGIPGHKYSYGVLRFQKPLEPSVEPRLLSTTRLILTGGGIQATLCLYKLNSFTMVDSIRELSPAAEFVAA